jgi:hypothetical protein
MAEVRRENNTIYILDIVAKPRTLLVRWLAVDATCCPCHHAAIMIFTPPFSHHRRGSKNFSYFLVCVHYSIFFSFYVYYVPFCSNVHFSGLFFVTYTYYVPFYSNVTSVIFFMYIMCLFCSTVQCTSVIFSFLRILYVFFLIFIHVLSNFCELLIQYVM